MQNECNRDVARIAWYTGKIAQLGAIHPSKRTARHDRRAIRLVAYKHALNARLKRWRSESVYVFYRLNQERTAYTLEFNSEKVVIDRDTWNRLIEKQHGRSVSSGLSLSGGIHVEYSEVARCYSRLK